MPSSPDRPNVLIVPGRDIHFNNGTVRGGASLYRPLSKRLTDRGVSVTVLPDLNWRDIRDIENRVHKNVGVLSKNVHPVVVIGDDWGGRAAYDLAVAETRGIKGLVVVSSPIRRRYVDQSPRVKDQMTEEDFDRNQTAPLRRGVKVLTIFPKNDPEVTGNNGTFPDEQGIRTIVHGPVPSHAAGRAAILGSEERINVIVDFVLAGDN